MVLNGNFGIKHWITKQDIVLCDIAALEVTRIFYQLLPKDDKEKLENLDYFLIDLKNENKSWICITIQRATGFSWGEYCQ
jgi:hypothetical protein